MHLRIYAFDQETRVRYENHGHYHTGDAGLDLFLRQEMIIPGGVTMPLHLQIACEPTDGRPYLLMPRSSISRTPLRMSNSIGLIDGGYRGEIIAMVDNIKDDDFSVHVDDRLFQLVAMDGSPISFELVDELSDTTRGSGGFGSTGK